MAVLMWNTYALSREYVFYKNDNLAILNTMIIWVKIKICVWKIRV